MEASYKRDFLILPHSPKEWYEIFNSDTFDASYYYPINDLGISYTATATTIKVWSPTAKSITLNLYDDGYESPVKKQVQLSYSNQYPGLWEVIIQGDYKGSYYTFTTNADGKEVEAGDPYAKACGVNGLRSMIIDLTETNPDKWTEDHHVFHPVNQTVLYELHIGDFSNDPNSGISPIHQGKYLAFIENSCLNKDPNKPTGLEYIKKLGITSIHLMPCYDYGSIDESIKDNKDFNWGYDPLNYNIPEGSYSTNPFKGEVRIREFKQMIQAIHNAGLSVIMDVVYNHTYSTESCFNASVPFYYYRQEANGDYCDGSGCGNDTASERKMMHKYIVESVLYWFNEYHIDGFRFDLMGLHDTELMNDIRSTIDNEIDGSKVIIYGEPWTCDKTNMKEGFRPADKKNINLLHNHIAMFNDNLRDAIKGKFNNKEPGFVNGGIGFEKNIERYFSGKISLEFPQPNYPSRLISYASCHDNNTLWDKLVMSVLVKEDYIIRNKELVLMNKLSASLVFLSFGVPFLLAGEEAARTKLGKENSFNLSKELNQLDWVRIYEFEDLVKYYRKMIQLRKQLSSFYKLKTVKIQWMQNLPKGIVACSIKIPKNNDMTDLMIIFNASETDAIIPIQGTWKLLFCSSETETKEVLEISKQITSLQLSTNVLVK